MEGEFSTQNIILPREGIGIIIGGFCVHNNNHGCVFFEKVIERWGEGVI